MKPIIVLAAAVLCAVSGPALAAQLKLTGTHGPTVVTSPYTGVVNKGTIAGGPSVGLTVTGTAAQKIVNKGTISGSTGISVSNTSGPVVIINRGTIVGGIKIGP
jgi:hypothetical protein